MTICSINYKNCLVCSIHLPGIFQAKMTNSMYAYTPCVTWIHPSFIKIMPCHIPTLMPFGSAHTHLFHQGQLYCAVQVRCRAHSPECCSLWDVGPVHLLPWHQCQISWLPKGVRDITPAPMSPHGRDFLQTVALKNDPYRTNVYS